MDLQLAVFSPNRCCRIFFQVTRRAPTRKSPKVLKSNTAPAGNWPRLGTGPKRKFGPRFFDFLEILLSHFDESIFSETRKNFRSNGLGLISLYALWKKLLGVQTRDFGPIFGKSQKTRKSSILDRFGPPIGRFFAKSVLPHIFPSDS